MDHGDEMLSPEGTGPEIAESAELPDEAPDIPESAAELDPQARAASPEFVGTEHTEIYHSPETIPEKEPGTGARPSWDNAPDASGVLSEIERIQQLPASERRGAMGDFVMSLRDSQGNETALGRDLRLNTQVERNGDGITITDAQGNKHTVWYK